MLGQRPADTYRAYRRRTSDSHRRAPKGPRRPRYLVERLVIGIMILAALFVLLMGYWAFTDRGSQQQEQAEPTATVGERPRAALRLLVRGEDGNPVPNALVEFSDKFRQLVASERTDPGGQATAFLPVGDGYSVAVRILGYEIGRLQELTVTAQSVSEPSSPRLEITLEPAPGSRLGLASPVIVRAPAVPATPGTAGGSPGAGGIPPGATSIPPTTSPVTNVAGTAGREAATNPAPNGARNDSDDRPGTAPGASSEAAPPVVPRLIGPLLLVAHPAAQFTAIDPASNLPVRRTEPTRWRAFPLLALSHDGRHLWVGQRDSSRVLVLNPADLTVTGIIELGEGISLTAMAADPVADRLWAATLEGGRLVRQVLELSSASQSVVQRYDIPASASRIGIRPDGEMLYLLHRTARRVSLLRPRDGRIVRTTAIIDRWLPGLFEADPSTGVPQRRRWPAELTVAPNQPSLYVSSAAADELLILDAQSGDLRQTITVGQGIVGVVAHPDGHHLYMANQPLGMVQVVDLSSGQVQDAIPVGQSPRAMLLSADASQLYVANLSSNTISVIDVAERRVADTIEVAAQPLSLVLTQ